MTRYTLIVGDAATYEERGTDTADFQTIDFIKTFFTFEEAEAVGEDAIARGGHDTYVVLNNCYGVVTYNPKQGASK
jgi:hypothetical protein